MRRLVVFAFGIDVIVDGGSDAELALLLRVVQLLFSRLQTGTRGPRGASRGFVRTRREAGAQMAPTCRRKRNEVVHGE